MRKLTQGQRLLGILYKSGPVAQEEAREAIIGAAACSRNQARSFPPHGRCTFDATLLTYTCERSACMQELPQPTHGETEEHIDPLDLEYDRFDV
jgi:hypothetical protein